jgi:hypothetical protein
MFPSSLLVLHPMTRQDSDSLPTRCGHSHFRSVDAIPEKAASNRVDFNEPLRVIPCDNCLNPPQLGGRRDFLILVPVLVLKGRWPSALLFMRDDRMNLRDCQAHSPVYLETTDFVG